MELARNLGDNVRYLRELGKHVLTESFTTRDPQGTSGKRNDHYVRNAEDTLRDNEPDRREFRWLVGPTGVLEDAETREGGRHLVAIICSQAAGIAKGRAFEKLLKPGIFVRADRSQ